MKESRSTWVSLLIRKGMCSLFCPRDRMHSCGNQMHSHDVGRMQKMMPIIATGSLYQAQSDLNLGGERGRYLKNEDTAIIGTFCKGITIHTQVSIIQYIYSQYFPLQCLDESTGKPYSTFSARRLRLISAVSIIVCRSLLLTSVPRSFPARSTRENLPWSSLCRLKITCRMAWERDELALANVWPDVLEQG